MEFLEAKLTGFKSLKWILRNCKNFRGQFQQHFTRTFFVQKFIQSQTLSREKVPKSLSYEKWTHKMLMKLTPGVDPTKIFFSVFFSSALS